MAMYVEGGPMNKQERFLQCTTCNQPEWAVVYDLGSHYAVNYVVCGRSVRALKK
jgi:hypothetical protein